MFIELTGVGGNKFIINLNLVETINLGDDLTYVYINNLSNPLKVKESYEQVKELIKNEVAAERGYWYE